MAFIPLQQRGLYYSQLFSNTVAFSEAGLG